MSEASRQQEQRLRSRLEETEGRLTGLGADLGALDRQLEELAGDRQRFAVLGQVCTGLEQLGELDAAHLFWEGSGANGHAEAHLRVVRSRLDAFEKEIAEIEARRGEITEAIDHAEDAACWIEDDLLELEREAEAKKLEWIPEREVDALPLHESRMPWARGGEDDRRFRKTLLATLLASLLLGLVLPWIDLPIPDPWEEVEVPERFARLVTEIRPPPPPVVQESRPEVSDEPEPTDELVPEETKTAAKAEADPGPSTASKGILAFREKFSGLAALDPTAKLGAQATIGESAEASRTTRSLVATQAPGSSGGVNLASLSRNVGGGGSGIEGVEVGRATSSIGAGGGSDRPLAGGGPGLGRTDEEIQIVFDRHKSALYRLYNRELRRNPTLQGQMVLRPTIEPDGSVSLCELQSSDMKAPELAKRVVERVKGFDFGAKDVAPVTIVYPIDFLPAT